MSRKEGNETRETERAANTLEEKAAEYETFVFVFKLFLNLQQKSLLHSLTPKHSFFPLWQCPYMPGCFVFLYSQKKNIANLNSCTCLRCVARGFILLKHPHTTAAAWCYYLYLFTPFYTQPQRFCSECYREELPHSTGVAKRSENHRCLGWMEWTLKGI